MSSILRMSYPLPLRCIDKMSLETRRYLPSLHLNEKAATRPIRIKGLCQYANSPRFSSFSPSASHGEASKVKGVEETELQECYKKEVVIDGVSSEDSSSDSDDEPHLAAITSLKVYREALANNDQSKVIEMEAFFRSLEDERNSLKIKAASLSEEFAVEKDRILRISADFDNFRKRTGRERLSLLENTQGEVIESFLPVLDNFDRAKTQLRSETEGEEKINNSYQSIYKHFMEILTSLGVAAVETVGNAFDPLLHEAIMREDSTEFEEGIILQEFRKGFKLGEKLLRPAMVKVSAGPGPAKSKEDEAIKVDQVNDALVQKSI